MKTIPALILTAALYTPHWLPAAEPSSSSPSKPESSSAAATSAEAAATPESLKKVNGKSSDDATASNNAVQLTNSAAQTSAVDNDTNLLRMNFRDASLDLVLNYLSEAAGFVINIRPGTSVKGKVNVWSSEPLTRDEAVNLLDTQLNQNGLAAIRNGKTITIVKYEEAKTLNIPVIKGGDPEKIPISDKVVTQIIPVRFVEVTQLIKDLNPLVSDKTTMTADEAGNSIVITDTQANIRKVAEIIYAIDSSAEDFTEVRLFRLNNADPNDTADLLGSLFPDDTKQGTSGGQSPFASNPFFSRFASRFGGGGGPGSSGGAPGGGGGNSSNGQNQRIKKRNRVIAVADQRTASVVVSASKDLMEQIAEVITQLDGDSRGKKVVTVFDPQRTDPDELQKMMNEIFNKNGTANKQNASSQQTSVLNGRANSQNQQYNSTSRSSGLGSSSGRGSLGGGGGSFP